MAVVKKDQRIRIRLKGFDHKLIDASTIAVAVIPRGAGACCR